MTLAERLEGFYGTEGYHRFNLFTPIVATDGVIYFAKEGNAFWALDQMITMRMQLIEKGKDARTPAALWFASNLFSDITQRICAAIGGENGFPDIKIYSPYYAEDIKVDDGVGKFHDRIIFSTSEFDQNKMRNIIKKIITKRILRNIVIT